MAAMGAPGASMMPMQAGQPGASPFSMGSFGQPGQVDFGQMMGMFMMVMMQMLMMLMTLLQQQQPGAQASQADVGGPADGGGSVGSGPSQFADLQMDRDIPANIGEMNTTTNAEDSEALERSLAAIAEDPDGARLLEAARQNGVTIRVGSPSNDPNVRGVFTGDEIIVRDPRNIKTIVHELVHAATPHDGNSKEEEGIAEVVGTRVTRRIAEEEGLSATSLGAPEGSDQHIYTSKQEVDGYRHLTQRNEVRGSLNRIGVEAGV